MGQSVITSNAEVLSGTPVFAGTRVPVKNLIDCLEAGYSIDEFLGDFPSVSKEQVIQVLEEAKSKLLVTTP
jgi:uncharacterized protein (DUF433 family)